jgi:tRNA nucleotidyltransferase (CCA-adding enzyme)
MERHIEIISTHIHADCDAFSAMIAASKLYPKALLVFPGGKSENLQHFIQSEIFHFQEYHISDIPEDKIEKIILVDIRQPSRIGRISQILNNNPEIELHIFDHHPGKKDDLKGSVEVIKEVGSTTTILIDMLKEKNIELEPIEATVMALGIYEDTGFLCHPTTTEQDFQALTYLLSQGAELSLIPRFLKADLTTEQVSLLNELILGAETHYINGVKIVLASMQKDKYFNGLAILTQKYMNIENLDIVFSLVQMGNSIQLVARSRSKSFDVGEIAETFGGGGHPTAAAAVIKGLTLLEAKERLLTVLKEKIGLRKKAQDIMNTYIIAMQDKEKVCDALEVMNKYMINALPVKKGERVIGMVSRQIVDRALFHHLDTSPISEIISDRFKIIPPYEDLRKIEKLMIEENLRFVLIGKSADKIRGIISRMELFRQLYLLRRHEINNAEKQQKSQRNIRALMNKRISPQIMKILKTISNSAEDYGNRVYLVGGIVRDLFLNIGNKDIDIVVEGDGIAFAENLAEQLGAKIKSHKKYGTSVLMLPDGFRFDIATARTEYYAEPAALPVVKESVLRHDLYRRDFTINTLAIKLNQNEFGQLIDFFGGYRDIQQKTIRVLHSLSFIEDPTRAFRAVRFKHKLDFIIENQTLKLLAIAIHKGIFNRLSGSRILNELKLIFISDNAAEAAYTLNELGLLKVINASLICNKKTQKLLINLDKVINWYVFLNKEKKVRKWLLCLMALIATSSREAKTDLIHRLSIRGDAQDIILSYKENIDNLIFQLISRKSLLPSDIYQLLRPYSIEELLFALAQDRRKKVNATISLYLTELINKKIKISGNDLIRMGVKPGPALGKILKEIHLALLNGLVKNKNEEMDYAKKLIDKL